MHSLIQRTRQTLMTRAFSEIPESVLKGEKISQEVRRRVLPRRHRKLYTLTVREENEEKLRDFLPPKPIVPTGWKLEHQLNSNRFDLRKTVNIRDFGKEELHVIALMEVKQYEGTYRMDNGEREEEEYLFFSLFVQKERVPGALEFGLTSIDMELVMDSLAIHRNQEELEVARDSLLSTGHFTDSLKKHGQQRNLDCRRSRDRRYRGPMLNELDDDFSDEILDYLDERGVNNGFAEYIMAQAHFFEEDEYLNWLRLLKQFAE
ncbi:Mitochondrial glycoprotein [Trypanosoma melophagium]|uniref:Mitochondrial glycoprotein n=1 Tax=Trypanosoma melophagium TaxID=715481 RepID=UPI00351A2C10|nr:Mitochondrial glycoprotein [Trypanosoma melophagium]